MTIGKSGGPHQGVQDRRRLRVVVGMKQCSRPDVVCWVRYEITVHVIDGGRGVWQYVDGIGKGVRPTPQNMPPDGTAVVHSQSGCIRHAADERINARSSYFCIAGHEGESKLVTGLESQRRKDIRMGYHGPE